MLGGNNIFGQCASVSRALASLDDHSILIKANIKIFKIALVEITFHFILFNIEMVKKQKAFLMAINILVFSMMMFNL